MIEQRESRNSSKDDDDDERLDVVGLGDDCTASLPGNPFSGGILGSESYQIHIYHRINQPISLLPLLAD